MTAPSYTMLLPDEDIQKLGWTPQTCLTDALNMANGQPVNATYDLQADSNAYQVGWDAAGSAFIQNLFSKETVQLIQRKCGDYLIGVDSKGRRIIPATNVVEGVLYGVYRSHRPQTGDIYGKYLVTSDNERNDFSYIIDKAISVIVRAIRDEVETIQNNEKLSIWTTVLGDFNEHGLRQHSPLKIRERRPDNFQFHMRY